jgi:proline iminopeptidase
MLRICFIIALTLGLISCNSPGSPGHDGEAHPHNERRGYIEVPGGKVWYSMSGLEAGIPLLCLHGGPGVPSYYLNPLKALSDSRRIILYDQLGCGRSTRILDTGLMTVDHFVEELEILRKALKLKEFYLLGQSWGTMLALDYYLKYPSAVKGLIFCSPAHSIPRWLADADTLIETMPADVQRAIRVHEAAGTYTDPEYQAAVRKYYERYVCRKLPWPADVDSSFARMGTNVYEYMGGPSEFTMTGVLKDYDRTVDLHRIKVPALFLTGEFDEARPATVKWYASKVRGAQFALIPGAAHMTMQDNAQGTNAAIISFLNGLEEL